MRPLHKIFLIIVFIFLFFLIITSSASGVYDPLSVENNKFGIHILNDLDVTNAAHLVNSSGGDWGYTTLVIREDERNMVRWQKVFDEMRELHLIPIVRIATKQTDYGWEKPLICDIEEWVDFLSSLNWVIKNRYVIIGNEPNHADEWGNSISPEEYTDYLVHISEQLKYKSGDFFVLPAGLDASAPTDDSHMSEIEFIRKMVSHNDRVFEYIDGWASHSYPNPDFSGSTSDIGWGTIKTYISEISYIKSLGIEKALPVFITETGWAHNKHKKVLGYSTPSVISENLKNAFENLWVEENIVTVTPFVLNYINPPFDIFSWTKPDGSFYEFYDVVKNINKTKGSPIQDDQARLRYRLSPEIFSKNGKRHSIGYMENKGQVIWRKGKLFTTSIGGIKYSIEPISISDEIYPGNTTLAYYTPLI